MNFFDVLYFSQYSVKVILENISTFFEMRIKIQQYLCN